VKKVRPQSGRNIRAAGGALRDIAGELIAKTLSRPQRRHPFHCPSLGSKSLANSWQVLGKYQRPRADATGLLVSRRSDETGARLY